MGETRQQRRARERAARKAQERWGLSAPGELVSVVAMYGYLGPEVDCRWGVLIVHADDEDGERPAFVQCAGNPSLHDAFHAGMGHLREITDATGLAFATTHVLMHDEGREVDWDPQGFTRHATDEGWLSCVMAEHGMPILVDGPE